MNHRPGLDRSQTLLFPERLEDYIAAENPARFLDAFVGSLDLHALGFARAVCARTGRPPYAPAALLKLYLYGYPVGRAVLPHRPNLAAPFPCIGMTFPNIGQSFRYVGK